MTDRARVAMIERRLRASLDRDRHHPSRLTINDDGTVAVRISGTSAGLVYALSSETGETDDAILQRFGHTYG